ncbi:MAG: RHS repeat domain-containing protein, partial [Pseudomonadota bacterium]
PFGVGLYGRSWSEGYRYGFNGKEREDALKSNSYDFGARVQSSILGRWLSLDAEFKEYPAFTPYASAGNNPIWALDPDGDRIIVYGQRYGFLGLRRLKYEYTPGAIAPTEASPFVHDAFNSLNYVHKADDAGVIDQVVGHRAKIRVVQSKDTFSRGRKIVWNETDALGLIEKDPNTGIYTKTGFSQSPALGLYHELVHAFRFLFFRKEVSDDLSTVVEEYDDMEEKKVIDNYETPVAKRLGEGIRKNHSGYSIKVESPVITEPIFDMREETEEEMIQKNFEPQNG